VPGTRFATDRGRARRAPRRRVTRWSSIWHVGPLTLIDAGTLLDEHTLRCGVVLDLAAMQALPLWLDLGRVTELEPVALTA
jgi:hypothetical protein